MSEAIPNAHLEEQRSDGELQTNREATSQATWILVTGIDHHAVEGRNVYGKTSTLLSLGLGMKPDLSGHRNVYLGGLAAGMRKAEIGEKSDSIVEYSDIGDATNRPVNTFSSDVFGTSRSLMRWQLNYTGLPLKS